MGLYFLDTGILLGYVRRSPYSEWVDATYSPSKPPNLSCTSVVVVAEMHSLSIRNHWGPKKEELLNALLKQVPAVDINRASVIEKLAEIDAYRLGRHPTVPLPTGMSARALGDNDIWIAATASVLKATLLTTDNDFQFLRKAFLEVVYVDPGMKLGQP